MSVCDHFQSPLADESQWGTFCENWCGLLASSLHEQLPVGYVADVNMERQVAVDSASPSQAGFAASDDTMTWMMPAPTQTVPVPSLPAEIYEVRVLNRNDAGTLCGVIEIVGSANKDADLHRDAFLSRCSAYLRNGTGLIVVDLVTTSTVRLHDALLQRLNAAAAIPLKSHLFAASYRLVRHFGEPHVDIWQSAVAVGKELPILPLWLPKAICLRVELGTTYAQACRQGRL